MFSSQHDGGLTWTGGRSVVVLNGVKSLRTSRGPRQLLYTYVGSVLDNVGLAAFWKRVSCLF
jgi:hypothetical protein